MVPLAHKSTACSLSQLNKEPLQCWALMERKTRDTKHLESNWRIISSSKVRCKKTEGEHFEEAVPSFREAVKQEIAKPKEINKQSWVKDVPTHKSNANFYFYMALFYCIDFKN